MNILVSVCIGLVIVGCQRELQSSKASATAGLPPDSAVSVVYEDSLLDTLLPGRIAITRTGDTLLKVGGAVLDDDYAVDEYRKNLTRFVRIQRLLGHKPNGWPILSTRARLALPGVDSLLELMFAGMCGIDNKGDPYVLAIARATADSVYHEIRYAWRFDRASETVREIPTANVVCWNVGEN
jgi:hypothetical protein